MNATKITITVGAKFKRDRSKIDTDRSTTHPSELDFMVERAQNYLLKTCGGYTIVRGNGGWREYMSRGSAGFHDWSEPVIVFSVTTTASNIAPREIAWELRDIFEQKCVALEMSSVDFDLI